MEDDDDHWLNRPPPLVVWVVVGLLLAAMVPLTCIEHSTKMRRFMPPVAWDAMEFQCARHCAARFGELSPSSLDCRGCNCHRP